MLYLTILNNYILSVEKVYSLRAMVFAQHSVCFPVFFPKKYAVCIFDTSLEGLKKDYIQKGKGQSSLNITYLVSK